MRIIIFCCLLFATISYSADNLAPSHTPSTNSFIGKTYTRIKDVDSLLTSGAFGTLNKDGAYAVSIHGSKRVLDNSRYPRFNYVFFTKTIGYENKKSILKILDVVTIDAHDFNDSATIRLDECNCKVQDQCQTVSVYNAESKLLKNGKKIKPIKIWEPNIATGKLEEKSPDNFQCGPMEPDEQ